jgi:hypothetical protein
LGAFRSWLTLNRIPAYFARSHLGSRSAFGWPWAVAADSPMTWERRASNCACASRGSARRSLWLAEPSAPAGRRERDAGSQPHDGGGRHRRRPGGRARQQSELSRWLSRVASVASLSAAGAAEAAHAAAADAVRRGALIAVPLAVRRVASRRIRCCMRQLSAAAALRPLGYMLHLWFGRRLHLERRMPRAACLLSRTACVCAQRIVSSVRCCQVLLAGLVRRRRSRAADACREVAAVGTSALPPPPGCVRAHAALLRA